MAQPRVYQSGAERQAAYRKRLAERRAVLGSGALVIRLAELERSIAAARRRADQADAKAVRAEHQLAAAHQALLATADQVTCLEAIVADLHRQLAAAHRRTAPGAPAVRQPLPELTDRTMNRAARRRAQRKQPQPR